MTGIRSKGKEFDSVIILDAVENIWPCKNPKTFTVDNLDEERRIFYVAMTRVKEELIITLPYIYGKKDVEPSRFLFESEIL